MLDVLDGPHWKGTEAGTVANAVALWGDVPVGGATRHYATLGLWPDNAHATTVTDHWTELSRKRPGSVVGPRW